MNQIITKYMMLVEKISNTVHMYNSFNTDVDIYRSEIHVIQLIGDHSKLYISEISRLIGVTKGTISQIIKRLEKKGLVNKYTDNDNNTRQLVQLTPKGQIAYKAHNQLHQQKHIEMNKFIDSLDSDKLAAIEDFITHAHDMIENHL